MIEFEMVHYRMWISPEEFSQMVGTTFLFPGLTALKLGALIGFKVHGYLGCFIALVCMNLPCIFLTIAGYIFLKSHGDNIYIKKIVILAQYAAVVFLASAVISIATPIIKTQFSIIYLVGAVVLFGAMVFYDLSPFLGLILYIGAFIFF
jgi:chromate transporter